jgi:hypothetical protein
VDTVSLIDSLWEDAGAYSPPLWRPTTAERVSMGYDQQLSVIRDTLDDRCRFMLSRKNRDKGKAFRSSIAVVTLTGVSTVLLGLDVATEVKPILSNIALALTATATVASAWAAFFNHKALWILRDNTLYRLK